MKKSLLRAVLFSATIIFACSCHQSKMTVNRGTYPVVKKIKANKSFHANFKSSKKRHIQSMDLASAKKNDRLHNKLASARLQHQPTTTTMDLDAIREAGRRMENPRKMLRAIATKHLHPDRTNDEILASLNENSLEYVILKKSLDKDRNRADAVQDPQGRKKDPFGLSIASFACAFVGLFIFSLPLGLVASVLAIIALRRYSKYGGKLKGFAIAGLVLGLLEVIIMALALGTI